jgi:glycosylphosphatidylinositol phospholipase D
VQACATKVKILVEISFLTENDFLAVQGTIIKSATTFEQCGAIYLLDVTDLLSRTGDTPLSKLHITTIFEGDRSYARFGWKLDWTDVNLDGIDDLVFSAPFRTDDITEELKGGDH